MMDLGLNLSPQQKQLAQANPQPYRWAWLQLGGAGEHTWTRLQDYLHAHQALHMRYERPQGATGLRQRRAATGALTLSWRRAADERLTSADQWLADARAHCAAEQPDLLAWLLGERLLLALPAYSADLRSVAQLRDALLGVPSGVEEPMQYEDYVLWINGLQQDEDAEQGTQFWRNLGLHALPGLRLVERYGVASGERGEQRRVLPEAVISALLAAEGDPQTTLLAAWAALLARLNGQRQAQVGIVHDPRDDYEELQGACGVFEQVLPMVVQLSEHSTLGSLSRQLSRQLEQAVAWQEYVGQAQLLPDCRASLQAAVQMSRVEGLEAVQWVSCETPVELLLHLSLDSSGRGQLALVYDAGLYRQAQMQRLLSRFAQWLERLLLAPQQVLDAVDALLDDERVAPETPTLPADLDIVAAVRRHAREHPERAALRFARQSFTYAQLDALSDQVAASLRQHGARRDQRVGLYLPRGAEMLVAMLACFKAGAAYLPLDPQQPPMRLASILQDAQPCVLLHAPDAAPDSDVPCLDWATAVQAPPIDGVEAAAADDLAYVLYTSGTSGRPKGVQIEQGQLRHYTTQVTHALQLPEGGHYGLVSSLLADLGNTVLFPAWLQGGCVHLLEQSVVTDAQAFAEAMREHPLDVLKIVPSHLLALLGGHTEAQSLPRQVLVLGGEPVSDTLLERLQQARSGCRVYNHYGPTETTVGVLWRALDLNGQRTDSTLNQVLGDNRIALLDEQGRAVPSGQAGELCITGASVGRGYLGGVEGSTFGVDPQDGRRRYRSGDLALRQADGSLRLLGRNDQQVKIRGLRLELGEVEQALRSEPGVEQAAVLLDGEGDHARLLAFVVTADDAGQVESLRDSLALRLPDYMLPSAVFALRTLPLTNNGKLDRQGLLALARQRLQHTRVPPRDAQEAAVLQIWSEVLDNTELGVTDNFFTVGGHSLAAIKVVSLLRERLGLDLPTKLLFERHTVRALVEGLQDGGDTPFQVLHDAGEHAPCVLLVHGAQGHVHTYQPLVERLGGRVSLYGLSAPEQGWDGRDMTALLDQYVLSLPAHLKSRPLVLLGWSVASRLALLLVPVLQAQGFEVAALAVIDHDPQRSLAGEDDEVGQLTADVAWYCRQQGHPMGEALHEHLDRTLAGLSYPDAVARLLQDPQAREHLGALADEHHLHAVLTAQRAIKTLLYQQRLPQVDVPVWLWRGNAHGDLSAQWQAHTSAQVQQWTLDVGHRALLDETRLVERLVALLAPFAARMESMP
ncbi:non-ribosomal peptide synthetase [Pseudomonas parafulva]|uniref:non-ribosomal peptide synthetase n=1 Tax=Pseudomonas parafulva TaxID=157782 RepID=UPI0005408D1D|nr:non-ribosomal peptide synthetase [Pseudomonas parafulva]AIZ33041.1 amino acid adenylation [Pseudomonas parafulva]